jgi:hypothetical protein
MSCGCRSSADGFDPIDAGRFDALDSDDLVHRYNRATHNP